MVASLDYGNIEQALLNWQGINSKTQKTQIMKQFIGLSLSMCIKDLIENKLGNDAQVLVIVSGTMFPEVNGNIDFEEVYNMYAVNRGYWKKYTKEQVKAAFDAVKVFQPRYHGQVPPNISNGHWVELPLTVPSI